MNPFKAIRGAWRVGAFILTVVLGVWGVTQLINGPDNDPVPPSSAIVQQAATVAAQAQVTVAKADGTIVQHQRRKAVVKQRQAEGSSLRQQLDTVSTAKDSITTQAKIITSQDSTIAVLSADNDSLASSLQETRNVLDTHTTVVIPAAALPDPTSHRAGGKSLLGRALSGVTSVTVGYGVQHRDGKFCSGPTGVVGLRYGIAGVGLGATYCEGAVRFGVATAIGLRISI